jgi:hypothetical protein
LPPKSPTLKTTRRRWAVLIRELRPLATREVLLHRCSLVLVDMWVHFFLFAPRFLRFLVSLIMYWRHRH